MAHNPIPEELEIANDLADTLLKCLRHGGWGTLTKPIRRASELRFSTTIWALRALNARTKDVLPSEARGALLSLIELRPSCDFGYVPEDDEPRVATISLFLILIFELADIALKKQILRSISIRSLLEKILVVLSESPFAEVEEFSTLQFDNVPAERLPFTHPSSLYGLTALMYWREFLTKEEQICLHRQVLNILQKFNSNKNSGVDLRNVNLQSRSNPVLYPISYLLQLLSAYGDAIRS